MQQFNLAPPLEAAFLDACIVAHQEGRLPNTTNLTFSRDEAPEMIRAEKAFIDAAVAAALKASRRSPEGDPLALAGAAEADRGSERELLRVAVLEALDEQGIEAEHHQVTFVSAFMYATRRAVINLCAAKVREARRAAHV